MPINTVCKGPNCYVRIDVDRVEEIADAFCSERCRNKARHVAGFMGQRVTFLSGAEVTALLEDDLLLDLTDESEPPWI